MWIIFKENYSGNLGQFIGGQKYDLPKETVERLPKECFEKSCAPWEEQTDSAAIAVITVHKKVAEAEKLAEKLQKITDEAARHRDDLVKVATEKRDAESDAELAAENAVAAAEKAKTKSMSANEKKRYKKLLAKAHELVAAHKRADLESQKASGLRTAAIADAELKHLDADAARTEADQLTADAQAETEKLAQKKAETAAKAKVEQEPNESENSEQKGPAEKTDAPQGDDSKPEG